MADLLLSKLLAPGQSVDIAMYDYLGEEEHVNSKTGEPFKKHRYRFLKDGETIIHLATDHQHNFYLKYFKQFEKLEARTDPYTKGKITFRSLE